MNTILSQKVPPPSTIQRKVNHQENIHHPNSSFLSASTSAFPYSEYKLNNSTMIHVHVKSLNQYRFILFFSAIVASGLISFALCLAAEFNKSKKNDLRFDGKLCYLPGSSAFGLGIAALICLSITQIIGSLFICSRFYSTEHSRGCKVRKPSVSCIILLVFSWISFGLAFVLIGGATSMSRSQPYGEGWLDGECYLVKDGVFAGSAILGLLALGSTLGLGSVTIRRRQAEEDRKVHAQADE